MLRAWKSQGTTWRICSQAKIKQADWVGIHDEEFKSESLEQVAARCGALMDGFIDRVSREVQSVATNELSPDEGVREDTDQDGPPPEEGAGPHHRNSGGQQ